MRGELVRRKQMRKSSNFSHGEMQMQFKGSVVEQSLLCSADKSVHRIHAVP